VTTRPLLAWGAVVAVLSFLLVIGTADRASGQAGFNPFFEVVLDNPEPEEPTDVTIDFGLPAKDLNFGAVVVFIPPEFGIVRGSAIPIGEPVGSLSAQATLGLINAACNTPIPVDFTFLNASLNREETVSFDDEEKEADLDPNTPGFGIRDFAEDKDDNGLDDAIDHYPEFLDRALGDAQPFRRTAGITPVAGTPVLLQLLVFDPGTKFDLIGEELDDLIPTDPTLGFPTIIVLQAIGDPDAEPEPGPITDFCTPLTSTAITLGTNMDADFDGTPNEDDTCPYQAHDRTGTHDADFDFLHSQCDPDDAENDDPALSGSNEDQDDDGVSNFADRCPLIADPEQVDTDEDFIGDECDENPQEPDGVLDLNVMPLDGTYKPTIFTVSQRDADGDGYANALDVCPYAANTGDPTIPASGDTDSDGMDVTCDPNDSLTGGGANTDVDGDGYLNRQDNCPLFPNGTEQTDEATRNQEDDDLDGIGNGCDNNPTAGDGELIQLTLDLPIVIGTGSGAGGPPSDTACPFCHRPGDEIQNHDETDEWMHCEARTGEAACGDQPTDSETPVETGDTPVATPKDEDGGGSSSGLIIGAAVIAAVVVIGGGAFMLLRRRGGA